MERFALIVERGGLAVTDRGGDLDRTLDYSAATSIVRLLPTGLLLILMGLVVLVLSDASEKPRSWGNTWLFVVLALVAGPVVVAWSLWTRAGARKPVFSLSPAGITHRWVREVLIPWREIQAIDSIDITTKMLSPVALFTSGPSQLYKYSFFYGVTAIVVSRQFYESRLFVGSAFLRGPGWKANFIPDGEVVRVALHHELVSVPRDELRRAVETRWQAFRHQKAAASVPASGALRPRPAGIAMGESPKSVPAWQAIQIALLSVGIAACLSNLAGLWQLDGQAAARDARARAAEDRRDRQASQKRMQEEDRQRAADDKRRQEENEAVLRRAFGR
jgi:hypothetical protein